MCSEAVLLLFPTDGCEMEGVRWQLAGLFGRATLLDIGLWFILTSGVGLELWFGLVGDDTQGLGLDLDSHPQVTDSHWSCTLTLSEFNLPALSWPRLGLNNPCRRKA